MKPYYVIVFTTWLSYMLGYITSDVAIVGAFWTTCLIVVAYVNYRWTVYNMEEAFIKSLKEAFIKSLEEEE